MNYSRIIGFNIQLELKAKSINPVEFGKIIGFSESDIYRLIEGRLYVPPLQLKKIAKILNISMDRLLLKRTSEEYSSLNPSFSDFVDDINLEFILNLIDTYADLAEILQNNKVYSFPHHSYL